MFSRVLHDELAGRQRRNRRYSLRAFARDLGVHPGTLSQLLRGRRPPTPRKIRDLAPRLGLDPVMVTDCCNAATDAGVRAVIDRPSLRHDSRWIATRTGVSVDAVNAALFRMLAARTLRMVAPNVWRTDA